jgi:signal transduction histidine kinase
VSLDCSSAHASTELQELREENRRLRAELSSNRAALQHALDEAGRVHETAQRLTSMVSHELRTPLQALSLTLDSAILRLRESPDHVPVRWMLERLDRANKLGTRLGDLVRLFLSASQIDAGQLRLEREEMDLAAQAHATVRRMKEDLQWAGCPCEVEASGPVRGRWDPLHVDLMVSNLLSNAMKYATGSPVRVRVESGSQWAQLSVIDSGPGIARSAQQRLFQPFSRLETSARISGFGLGLWIVKHLAQAHGGSVELDSELGQGATFRVLLPR